MKKGADCWVLLQLQMSFASPHFFTFAARLRSLDAVLSSRSVVLHLFLEPLDLGRCGRDERGQPLKPVELHLLTDVVVVIVSLGCDVDDDDDHLDGHRAQDDDDDDGEYAHCCTSNRHKPILQI